MKKILVADDERALRFLIVGTLEIDDFEILEADNGIEAVRVIEQERPDLAIVDVMMPGMTGYEVCSFVKSNEDLKGTKILILTAKGQQTDEKRAMEVQADRYMAKPFSPAELLAAVEEMLEI